MGMMVEENGCGWWETVDVDGAGTGENVGEAG